MRDELNPQREQMADESMVRCLAAQAACIWPQEEPLIRRYGVPPDAAVLDAGCGTGEITGRLAAMFPDAQVLGVDILDPHLASARSRWPSPNLRFENRSIYSLGLPDDAFDLVTCRHVVQSVPHVDRVLAELRRVLKPGGVIHVIAEDYGMIHFPVRRLDPDELWHHGPPSFGRASGTDMRVGRSAWRLLREAGFGDVTVDHLPVDTVRAPREEFARIWEAWRDGYSEVLSKHSHFSVPEVRAHFDDMIATLLDPESYALWLLPVLSGRKGVGSLLKRPGAF